MNETKSEPFELLLDQISAKAEKLSSKDLSRDEIDSIALQLKQISKKLRVAWTEKKCIAKNKQTTKHTEKEAPLLNIKDVIDYRDLSSLKYHLVSGGYDLEQDIKKDNINNQDSGDVDGEPLLLSLNRYGWFEGSNFVLTHIYDFDKSHNLNGIFVKKYLNMAQCIQFNDTDCLFFGIDLNSTKMQAECKDVYNNNNTNAREFIVRIIKSKELNEIKNEKFVYYCVLHRLFDFLQLIFEYRSDDLGIINGINCYHDGFTPLLKLVTSMWLDDGDAHLINGNVAKWLNLLLSVKNIDINLKCLNKNNIFCKQNAKRIVIEIYNDQSLVNIFNQFEKKNDNVIKKTKEKETVPGKELNQENPKLHEENYRILYPPTYDVASDDRGVVTLDDQNQDGESVRDNDDIKCID